MNIQNEWIVPLQHEIENYVIDFFAQHPSSFLSYHNLTHTRSVVKHSVEIAAHYNLTETEQFILLTAAWFHDTGQLISPQLGHEEESVRLFKYFISTFTEVPEGVVDIIEQCILATKMPQVPQTLLEDILCDADLYHLGTDDFKTINELVKQEMTLRSGPIDHWNALTIKLLMRHHYHTSYCREKLEAGKQANLAMLLADQS